MTAITVSDLTQASIDGTGVFDVLMRATKAHLDSEYQQNRIKGTDYSTVYLGSLQQTMQTALTFLMENQKATLEAQLLEVQILKAQKEAEILELSKAKLNDEILHLKAQTALVTQQKDNLASEKFSIEAKTALTAQQKLNAEVEHLVLEAQKCKLDAEFDNIQGNTLRVAAETALLGQKKVTEQAQVADGVAVDNSVLGRQKKLYEAQANGFQRDAEQKAASILADVWKAHRMTDDGLARGADTGLDNEMIRKVVTKLATGIGA